MAIKQLFLGLLALSMVCVLCCAPIVEEDTTAEAELPEEEAPQGVLFTLYPAEGEPRQEQFFAACESAHAVAYVQAHAVSEAVAEELLDRFETEIFPRLAAPSLLDEAKLSVLLSYMGGGIYGYAPFPVLEQGPVICLNALYPEDLAYALCHEYQHLCAYDACGAGGTSLTEETDELLSDVFCELVFRGRGQERGILSEERTRAAQQKLSAWGDDALLHAHELLRAGYSEKEMLLAMENR